MNLPRTVTFFPAIVRSDLKSRTRSYDALPISFTSRAAGDTSAGRCRPALPARAAQMWYGVAVSMLHLPFSQDLDFSITGPEILTAGGSSH